MLATLANKWNRLGHMMTKSPHNLEAERAILAAILIDSQVMHSTIERLQPADFFIDSHRRIFRHMVNLWKESRPIDPVILDEELGRANELEAVGGSTYIGALMDGMPRTSNIEHYIRIVKNKALLRDLFTLGHDIECRVLEGNESIQEIVDNARSRLEILSALSEVEVLAGSCLTFKSGAQVASEVPGEVEWLAKPWVAAGSITEIAGKVKQSGKTTFATHLVAACIHGNPFMGQPTMGTPVVYLTEQSVTTFRVSLERAGLLGRDELRVLFWKDAAGFNWNSVVQAAVAECKRIGARLLVVDTLPQFAGIQSDEENNAGDALAAMAPLQLAAAEGLAILIIRHERKGGGQVGDSGRGSSAYAGAVDTLISLRRPEGNHRRTLRLVQAISRLDEVPEELVIELTETGYAALGNVSDVAAREAEKTILKEAIHSEVGAETLDELISGTEVKRATAQRAIKKLLKEGYISRSGAGRKNDPYRYWRPGERPAQTPNSNGQTERG